MPGVRLAIAAAMALAAAPVAAAPLEAYGKLPTIEDVAISPDGARLAIVMTDGEQRSVAIATIADNKLTEGVKAGDSKVRAIRWAGPMHVLITVSSTTYAPGVIAPRTDWQMVDDFDLQTRAQHQLLADQASNPDDRMTVVMGPPAVRIIGGTPYAFVQGVHFVDGEGRASLYRINLDANTSMMKAEATRDTDQWLVDAGGEPVAETEYNAGAGVWTLKAARPGGWRVVKSLDEMKIGHPVIAGLGPDGRSAVIDETDGDAESMRQLAPGADDWSAPTSVNDDEDLVFDPVTEQLIGTHRLVGDEDRYIFLSPSDQQFWNAAAKAFQGQRVTLISMSADHRKLVVLADSPSTGPCYFLVDLDKKSAAPIGTVHASLTADDISETRAIAFKAADGLPLTGYLTLPRGRDPKSLPLVVFPHGGPAARDEPGFDWWAQAMASRGYAVLQVNFRGSDGFGFDFLKAGFGQWGRKMQTDLSDGVRYLQAQGLIDPKRVCIVGASYGGYAALAGPTLDPGVYRCAVSVAGISDLRRFVRWSKSEFDVSTQRYWTRFLGASGPDDPLLADLSPADHADRVTVPILLIHGRDDTTVPFEQSQIMADALKRAGKSVDVVVLNHEDHYLSRGDTRLQMLQATMDFLEKNNPPT